MIAMTFEQIEIGSFLEAVINLIAPILLTAIGGSMAFSLIRLGLKWGKRST